MRTQVLFVLAAIVALVARAPAADSSARLKVFLLAGQSNMEGKGDGGKLTADEQRRLTAAGARVLLAYNREPIAPLGVVKASAGVRKKFGGETTFGPELFFGLRVAEAMPGQRVLLIKRSVGATSLQGRWNPDWSREKAAMMGEENAEPLYPDFIAYVRQVLSAYRPEDYELAGMLWVQGEADSNVSGRGPEPAAAYERNLRELIRRVRLDLGADRLPFLLVQVGGGKVTDGMRAVASSVANVTLIPQSTDPASPHFFPKHEVGHYNYEGMKRMGTLLGDAYLERYAARAR